MPGRKEDAIWLLNATIAEYGQGNRFNHEDAPATEIAAAQEAD